MYGCESWTIKKADSWRIDAFKLWCWRRLLRDPRNARRSNQSLIKEINHEYLLEGLMLKLQYFGHLIWRANSLEKTLMLGKIQGKKRRRWQRRRGWQRMRRLDGITDSMDMSFSKLRRQWRTGKADVLQSMGLQRVRQNLGTEHQQYLFFVILFKIMVPIRHWIESPLLYEWEDFVSLC